jgi:hypothetical protein
MPDATGHSATYGPLEPSEPPVDLHNLPEEYHDFADVFSKTKAWDLPEHRPYNLKINLEDGAQPPFGPIYSISPLELETFREFIDKNLQAGFVHSSRSPCGAPILFSQKKNGSLQLCVDFQGLNCITKKDCYPIPLTVDLLDAPQTVPIYTKSDLKHTYHLVWIVLP